MKNGRIVYIIDGPDGTGKSTLANKLSDTFKLPIYHLTYFSDPELHNEQFSNALNLLRNSDTGFILDRYIFLNRFIQMFTGIRNIFHCWTIALMHLYIPMLMLF